MTGTDSPSPPDETPYRNPDLPVETRVEDLLGRMTREEKIGQLGQIVQQLHGMSDEVSLPSFGDSPGGFLAEIRKGRWGSRIVAESAWGGSTDQSHIKPEELEAQQRAAVEESRLGIPLLYGRDVIHGHRTVFPIPIAQAATFDPELVEAGCEAFAREAAAEGLHWTFAPMLDIARDPRWGRIVEGYGEDPFLCSAMAAASVRGLQGDDPSRPGRLLACAKHFAGYGGAEGGRDYDTAEFSENTLHNVILPPFEAAAKAGCATMMSGFHDLGGTSASASRTLMTNWLKEELGWDGFIVSDWGSVWDLLAHGLAGDEAEAAELAFNAGVDMEMTADYFEKHLGNLVDAGRVTEDRLDDAVRRVLRAKFRKGLFDRPYPDTSRRAEILRAPEHIDLARRSAEAAVVLLRNHDAVLPLDPARFGSIALVGPYAEARRQLMGAWVCDGVPEEVVSLRRGFEEWIEANAPDTRLHVGCSPFTDEMIDTARKGDVIVLCLGESHHSTGENRNVSRLGLPPGQEEMIEACARWGKPLVVLLCNGRPLPSPAAQNHAAAILQCWHLGSEMGRAVAAVLFGDVAPSGRLPVTIPRHAGQIPLYYNRKFPGKLAQMGGQAHYVDETWDPLYPFGFGLGYTTFRYGETVLSGPVLRPGETLEASVELTNTGGRPGVETVQLYLRDPVASTARPVRELKGFQRIHLDPGQSTRVTFALSESLLAFYGARRKREAEPGEFHVGIGADSRTPLDAGFTLER
ncbi:MAG: glycoside hydrolase family 3 N-terminal domain-containing protein [Puniceicoccaceae bacterium]